MNIQKKQKEKKRTKTDTGKLIKKNSEAQNKLWS